MFLDVGEGTLNGLCASRCREARKQLTGFEDRRNIPRKPRTAAVQGLPRQPTLQQPCNTAAPAQGPSSPAATRQKEHEEKGRRTTSPTQAARSCLTLGLCERTCVATAASQAIHSEGRMNESKADPHHKSTR